jgi:hypothetical protein
MDNIANNSLCHCNDMHPSKLTVVMLQFGGFQDIQTFEVTILMLDSATAR